MSRPDDVPSWKESTRRSWNWSKWLLLLIPTAYAMAILLPGFIYLEPQTAKQTEEVRKTTEFMTVALPCVAAFIWALIFLNGITIERTAKTPKEIEEKERALLAALKSKYGEE